MSERDPWSLRVFSACTFVCFVVVVALPVAAIAVRSMTPEALSTVLRDSRQWVFLRNTLIIAAGTSLLATGIGVAMGYAIERGLSLGSRLLPFCVAVAFLTPPYVFAVAWIDLVGNSGILRELSRDLLHLGAPLPELYTIPGVMFELSLCYYPVVAFATAASLKRYDARLSEAARLVHRPSAALLHVTLPILAPGILAGSCFVFLLALVAFSVPSLLQVNVYPVEIYTQFSAFYDIPTAAAQALPLILCGAVAVAFYAVYVRPRQAWLTGRRRAEASHAASRPVRIAWTVCCWGVVLVSTVLPIAVLVRRALPLGTFVEVWQTAKEEILTSLVVAASAATALTILAVAIAFLDRRRCAWRRLQPLDIVPFLMSGPVLGIGFIVLLNRPGFLAEAVYDSLAVLVLACTARFLFFARQGVGVAIRELHPSLDEAASIAGVAWWRRLTGVLLPLLRRSGLRLRLRTDLRGVGLGKAFRLGAWTVGLITIMQVTQIVVIRLATSATAVAAATDVGRGAGIAVYNNAFLIIMVPHSIITVSLATALLPDLSRTAAAAQTELLRTRVMGALRVALAVIIPFAGLLAAVAGPISVLLFGYGAASDDVDLVALTLALFVPGLVGFTTTFLVQRAFYAQEDTRTPVLVQLIVSAVQISLSVTIVPRIDPQLVSAALAGCWSVATLTGALASMWLLHRRLGRLGGLRFTGFVLAVGIAALPGTILALRLTLRYPQIAVGSPLGALATLAAGAAVAASVYVLVAWLVRIGPVRDAVAVVVDVVRTRIGARR